MYYVMKKQNMIHGSETYTQEISIEIFKRKIFPRIIGPIWDKGTYSRIALGILSINIL